MTQSENTANIPTGPLPDTIKIKQEDSLERIAKEKAIDPREFEEINVLARSKPDMKRKRKAGKDPAQMGNFIN